MMILGMVYPIGSNRYRMDILHCKVGFRQAVAAKEARVASLNQDVVDRLDQLGRLMQGLGHSMPIVKNIEGKQNS